MNKYINHSELSPSQLQQYKTAVHNAFPPLTASSQVTIKYWSKVEDYFPIYQLYLIDDNNDLIGFFNAIPVFWDRPLVKLPDEGWDWLVKKGVNDFENNIKPNQLGGLQIIVTKQNQGKGYSKQIIKKAKELMIQSGFDNLIIPIRPTNKSKHPEMEMRDYMNLKKDHKIYDPWIRTHLNSGAKITGICSNSMNIYGDIPFWERIMNRKIVDSGIYIVDGALSPVEISIENNYGEYQEVNIWISYLAID